MQNMTYAQQLKDYEEAVMAKRLEEMPEVSASAYHPPATMLHLFAPADPTLPAVHVVETLICHLYI